MLQHPPHGFDVFRRVAPVSGSVDVAHKERVLEPSLNASHTSRDLTSYKSLSPARAFVIEQDAVDGEHPVSFAIVARHPVAVDFRRAIGAPGIQWGLFVLWWRGCAKHLRTAGLIKAAVQPDHADGLQQSGGAHARRVTRVLGLVEADAHVALSTEVVNLVRRHASE